MQAIVNDAEVHVYVTKNGGTVDLTASNNVETTFPQGSGYREYTANPADGWIWKGWTYGQFYEEKDLGNRTDFVLGMGNRYSFSNSGSDWNSAYNGTGQTISVNRLFTTGETIGNKITYNLYANFNPTINATAEGGGTITDSGVTEVNYGDSKQYNITAAAGQDIASVSVDGEDISDAVGQDNFSYTFENVREPHTINATFTNKLYTVTYTDGVDNEEIFEDQSYADLLSETKTPKFNGEPKRTGYVFTGWAPEVTETVTQTVTYSAQWAVDENGNGNPDNDEKYTVSYQFINEADGKDLPEKVKTMLPKAQEYVYGVKVVPAVLGTDRVETNDGVWIFEGWKPEEVEKLTADNVFTGTWTFVKNASVINQIPVINAEDKTITVGDTFDPMKDVTASDKEDGDLTTEIKIISNNVDTSKAGTYTVTYKVTDKNGASITKTITVTVKDKGDVTEYQVELIYDANGGTGTMGPITGDVGSKIVIGQNCFARSGYTFTGWNTQADGKGTAYKPGDSFTLTDKDTVLYAQWSKNSGSAGTGTNGTAKPTDIPKTGDNSNLTLWFALLIVSGGAVIATAVISSKKKRSEK